MMIDGRDVSIFLAGLLTGGTLTMLALLLAAAWHDDEE